MANEMDAIRRLEREWRDLIAHQKSAQDIRRIEDLSRRIFDLKEAQKALKEQILEEMIIEDDLAYQIAKELWPDRAWILKAKYQKLSSFDDLLAEVRQVKAKIEKEAA